MRQWVAFDGVSKHFLVVLELVLVGKKLLSPFKFNLEWLKEADLVKLVESKWLPFMEGRIESTTFQFKMNLKRIK